MRAWRGLAVLTVAGALLLSGCSVLGEVLGGDEPVRDGESQEITEGGDLDVFTLKLGDCFDDVDGTQVTEIPVIPCAEPHDNEVYHEYTLPDGEFPGDESVNASATEQCEAEFAEFVGMAYADSALDFGYFVPTSGSWDEGDRVVQCMVYEPSAKVSGTLAGAAR